MTKETIAQKSQNNTPAALQAMVWYRSEDWQELLTIFDDADRLPRSFSDWEKLAEAKKDEVEAMGCRVIKVYIDPTTFPQWCQDNNCAMDAAARTQLAIQMAQAQSFAL